MRWWLRRAALSLTVLLIAGGVDALLPSDEGPAGFALVLVSGVAALIFVVALGGLALTALRER